MLAIELDPVSPTVRRNVLVHYYARRFVEAEASLRRAVEFAPGSVPSRLILAWTLLAAGRARDAQQACALVLAAQPPSDQAMAVAAHAAFLIGDRARAEELRRSLNRRPAPASAPVRLHVGPGHADQAFAALERAVARTGRPRRGPGRGSLYDGLRADPRFAALTARVGLEPRGASGAR